jgi:hypothetical protein
MTKLVVAFMVYFDDSWYGSHYRYYYAGPEDTGFKNKTEAKKYASALKKYVKSRIKTSFGNKASISHIDIGDINTMETYRYFGAGPSWSCKNYEVSVNDITSILTTAKNK